MGIKIDINKFYREYRLHRDQYGLCADRRPPERGGNNLMWTGFEHDVKSKLKIMVVE